MSAPFTQWLLRGAVATDCTFAVQVTRWHRFVHIEGRSATPEGKGESAAAAAA